MSVLRYSFHHSLAVRQLYLLLIFGLGTCHTEISVVAASVLSRTVRVVTTDVDKLIPTDVSSLTRKALSKGAALSESILRFTN